MGFLEFNKINSLEMFLTDKGKELMMKQNNLGLSELITRFTLYDEDFDYRTTSKKWWDGVSPNPQMNTPPGSDQGLVNDFAIFGHQNPTWQNPTTGQTNYHDITDVRGHRGHNVLSCFPELDTVHIENCTNIYCFYDVTSVLFASAEVAKISLNAWATGYSQTNSAWTGMVFHIPVYGERWINSSYYPWNGELDVLSYDIAGSGCAGAGPNYSPNSCTLATGIPPIAGSITVYDDGTTITPVDDPSAHDNGAYYGVTGLFNGVMCNQPYPTTGWSVLPPGTITSATEGGHIPGSKLEWWVTGCTYNPDNRQYHISHYENGSVRALTATTCVHTGSISDICDGITGYTSGSIYPYTCTGTSWSTSLSGYTVPIIEYPTSAVPPLTETGPGCPTFKIGASINGGWEVYNDYYHSYASKELDPNQCEGNCCADDVAISGSIFGCKDCNPHRNSISVTSGRTITYILTKLNGGACNENNHIHTYDMGRTIRHWQAPCDEYKGGDRNVLIINNTDETVDAFGLGHCCSNTTAGGIMPLGEKKYYGKGAVTVSNPNTNTIATWGVPFGERGYQGPIGATTGTINMPATQEYYMGWSEMTDPNIILQPSKDWMYSQDLHCRSLAFYNTFLGFLYPVVQRPSFQNLGFLQHSYAAIMGTTVPLADLPVNATAQSIVGAPIINALQALSSDVTSLGVVGQNPYSELIPVQYSISQYMLTQGYGPTKTPAWGYTLQGNMNDQMNEGQTDKKIISGLDATWINCNNLSGLRNYGWGIDAEIGCTVQSCACGSKMCCCGADMFSPAVYINSLNRFLSGDTVSQVRTVCTYCQCLPTVFINRTGPPGPIIVNPCTNPPCNPPPVTIDQLCGPTPVLGTTINTNFTASNPFAPNKNDY